MAIERWETKLDSGIGRAEALRVVVGCIFVVGLLLAGWIWG